MINENIKPEKRDRLDEFMRERHKSAVAGLKVEEALSFIDSSVKSDGYPTSQSPENVAIKGKAESIISEIFKDTKDNYPAKYESLLDAVRRYIIAKVTADRFQLDLGVEIEEAGHRKTASEAGAMIFEKQTNKKPIDRVSMIKEGGYINLLFYDERDYNEFVGKKFEKSAGLFHRGIKLPNFGQVDFVLIKWTPDYDKHSIELHERQHFINSSIFGSFVDMETSTFWESQVISPKDYPTLSKAVEDGYGTRIRNTKDELLARIRDGGELYLVTNFWNNKLYDHLKEDERSEYLLEMQKLLDHIKKELEKAGGLFEGDNARGLLVYHLIDIPLLKFPERIEAVNRFYQKRMDRVLKYIPEERLAEIIEKSPPRDKLEELSRDIVGESYSADIYALGLAGDNLDEQDSELNKIEEKLRMLRAEYDSLLKSVYIKEI